MANEDVGVCILITEGASDMRRDVGGGSYSKSPW